MRVLASTSTLVLSGDTVASVDPDRIPAAARKEINSVELEINRIEEEVDVMGRKAVQELFAHEKDPIKIIKLKEIYDLLESTTDACEDVADALQNLGDRPTTLSTTLREWLAPGQDLKGAVDKICAAITDEM